jgi:hypothetical protein
MLVLFDVSKQGYDWFQIAPGIFWTLISLFGLVITYRKKMNRWILRLGISLFISIVWLSIALIGTYAEYTHSLDLYNSGTFMTTEGAVHIYSRTSRSKQDCTGFSVNHILFCYDDNPLIRKRDLEKYIKEGDAVRISYGTSKFDTNKNLILKIERNGQ